MKYLSISSCLIATLLIGTGCGNTPGGLERAQKTFADKVWTPFLSQNRCVNCHDFDNRKSTFIAGGGHPDRNATCTTCHTSTILGFTSPTWHLPPAEDNWNFFSDPNLIRDHLISGASTGTGFMLYTHLVGEGADKQPLVQWCFFNGPDTTGGGLGGTINAGKVPAGGVHSGQIPTGELLDWTSYKSAVEEWLCTEKLIGNNDLGLPDSVNCFQIVFCGTGGMMPFMVVTFGALACVATVRRIRRHRR